MRDQYATTGGGDGSAWWNIPQPAVPHLLGAGRLGKAAEAFAAGLLTAQGHARRGRSAQVGEAVMAAVWAAVAAAARPPSIVQRFCSGAAQGPMARAEQLVLAGEVRRGVAAMDGTIERDRAHEDALTQIVTGLEPLPPVAPPTHNAPATQDQEEHKEWVRAINAALQATPRRGAPGPSGMRGDLLRAILTERPELVGVLAELLPHLLASPPAAMARCRLTVIVKMKPTAGGGQRRKARAIACGEAITRLVERACLRRWREQFNAGAAHSTVQLRDGPLRTAAVIHHHRRKSSGVHRCAQGLRCCVTSGD